MDRHRDEQRSREHVEPEHHGAHEPRDQDAARALVEVREAENQGADGDRRPEVQCRAQITEQEAAVEQLLAHAGGDRDRGEPAQLVLRVRQDALELLDLTERPGPDGRVGLDRELPEGEPGPGGRQHDHARGQPPRRARR